jgi:hypothetical protein
MDNNKLTEQLLLNIIGHEMVLSADQLVVLNQNYKVPPDARIYVAAGAINVQPFASRTNMISVMPPAPEPQVLQQVEENTVQQRETIQIDIFGRGNDCLTRRWEIVAALKSIYSQQQQELYQFKIGTIPTGFTDSALAEGGSQLNRYSITVACLVWYKKSKPLSPDDGSYYDDFHTRVDNEKTIGTPTGLIEFENQG